MDEVRGSDVYRARIGEIADSRLVTAMLVLIEVASAVVQPDAWEGRYRVLVGPLDGSWEVGVREARTRRAAKRELAEVQALLSRLSADEARRALELTA